MCEPTTVAYLALAATAVSAYGSYEEGQTQKKIGRNNQIMAEYAAQANERQGDLDSQAARRKADQLKGAQRARLAANGLDMEVGTAADILDQTDFFAAQDQATIRNNAKRAAWSARAQGANFRAQGDAAAEQANLNAFGTILGGSSQVASKWYTPSSMGYDSRPNRAGA